MDESKGSEAAGLRAGSDSGPRWSRYRATALVAAALVGVVFLSVWVQVGNWRDERDLAMRRNLVAADLAVHRNALISALANRLALLEGLRAFVEVRLERGESLEQEYPAFASRLYGVARGTRNLGVAPGGVYRLVYPVKGNEAILGYNLFEDPRPEVVEDARRAMSVRSIVLSGPNELRQGGTGLIARGLVMENGKPWGLVGLAFELGPLLEEAQFLPPHARLKTALRLPGKPPFFGPADAFGNDALVEKVSLPNGAWEIGVRPVQGWYAEGAAARRLWLASGIALALLPLGLVFVVTWRQRLLEVSAADAERRVEEGTRALRRELEARQELERRLTDQQQLEAQYRHAQKMEAIGLLAGGVAHDFNNLLQVIAGYTGILLAGVTPEQRNYPELTEIRRATERATALVRQLLTFSRRQKIERQALDINDTIGNLLDMLRRLIGEHIELDFRPGCGVKGVRADAGLLEQLLVNLCVNARDAMPEGGRISISTGNVSIGPDFVEQRGWGAAGDYVLLSVSDTGPGIPPNVRDRIFEPFFTTKEIGKGTGLGLATVYGIVKQHEGMIELAPEGGPGALFQIYLPVSDQVQEAPRPSIGRAALPKGQATILVAEDEELVRSLAQRVLQRGGYRVLVARDGEEAIALVEARAHEIDLALLDLLMPKANGREVAERLKMLRPDVPVLFCSGYSRQMLDERMPDKGTELILKPYEPKALLERVHARLLRKADGV